MGLAFNIGLACFAALGSLLFGYDSGVMTDVIASENFLNFFNTTSTSPIIGAINSTFAGGACLGALFGGVIMDRLGRKLSITIGAWICVVGAVLQTAAYALAMLLVGRILTGFSVGLLSMAVPVYQSETAHPKVRGLIVGLAQQMIGVGYIISTWVGYGCGTVSVSSAVQWRVPLSIQTIPCLLLGCFMMFFPESPRHLIATDRDDEAMRVLRRLHYNGSNDDWLNTEFNEIKATIDAEKSMTAPGWLVMFKVPQWRHRLWLGCMVQTFGQMTAVNVIGYYQTIMYKSLGITGQRDLLVAGIYNIVGPVTNFFFITCLIDRVGRRKPLIYGTIAIVIALICEVAVCSQNEDGTNHSLSVAGVFFLFCITCIFSLSFGPISWVYMSEVMPFQIRAKGNAFATGIGNWAINVVISEVSPIALGNVGWKFYILFICFSVLITLPCLFLMFKETKGLSLEEVDLLFGDRALGNLPQDLNKDGAVEEIHEKAHGETDGEKVVAPAV